MVGLPASLRGIGTVATVSYTHLDVYKRQAYGAAGRPGGIPPYSDLVFDIELLNVTPAPSTLPTEKQGAVEK